MTISVSLDDPKEAGTLKSVLKFLDSRNAEFPNFILDESQEFWQEKFHAKAPPIIFVFNREGKWKQLPEEGDHYPEVEKLVNEFLKEK